MKVVQVRSGKSASYEDQKDYEGQEDHGQKEKVSFNQKTKVSFNQKAKVSFDQKNKVYSNQKDKVSFDLQDKIGSNQKLEQKSSGQKCEHGVLSLRVKIWVEEIGYC